MRVAWPFVGDVPFFSRFSLFLSLASCGGRNSNSYLQFPDAAGEPDWQLKGFSKTVPLAPGASSSIEIHLVARDFSIWNVSGSQWVVPSGTYDVAIGSSSRDIRLRGEWIEHRCIPSTSGQKAENEIILFIVCRFGLRYPLAGSMKQ